MKEWLRKLASRISLKGREGEASLAESRREDVGSGLSLLTSLQLSPPPEDLAPSPAASVPPSSCTMAHPEAPVTFENFSREYLGMSTLDSFQGFRLEASKPVAPRVQLSQSLALGMSSPGNLNNCSYHAGPTFSTADRRTMVMARMDLGGTVTARAVHQASDTVEMKASVSGSRKDESKNVFEVGVDKLGPRWTTSARAVWQGAWILNGAFSQVVSPQLQMGGDLTWVAANNATMGSMGGRYCFGRNVLSCLVLRQPDFAQNKPFPLCGEAHSAKVNLYHKVSDRLALGTEFEYSHPSSDSGLRVVADYLFRNARVQTAVDSGGKLSVFAQDASGVGVSGSADLWRDDYRVGIIMQMMPPSEG